jgi:hydroxymethylpyrimidine pyrophosphatase-like HAD family hydrolase
MQLEGMYIGFDRDGTLEMSGCFMSDQLIQQIRLLSIMGAKLFIASGKNYRLLANIFDGLGLKFWMICAENGGHIVIPEDDVDMIYSPSENHLDIFLQELNSLNLPEYKDEPKKAIWSKKFGHNSLLAKRIIDDFIKKNNLQLTVYAYPGGDGGLDVVPNGIDKVNLLPFIPTNAKIHYFGDGDNDISLMKHIRVTPHTVANANTEVKKIVMNRNGLCANYNAGQGVSDLLNKIFDI